MKDKLANVNIPDLASMQTIELNFSSGGNYRMPEDLIALMQTSDVTTITKNSQTLAGRMFEEMSPAIIAKINSGIDSGINGIDSGVSQLTAAISRMKSGSGYSTDTSGTKPAESLKSTTSAAIIGMENSLIQMTDLKDKMNKLKNTIPSAFETAKTNNIDEIGKKDTQLQAEFQTTLNRGFGNVYKTVVIASVIGLLLLVFYRVKRDEEISI